MDTRTLQISQSNLSQIDVFVEGFVVLTDRWLSLWVVFGVENHEYFQQKLHHTAVRTTRFNINRHKYCFVLANRPVVGNGLFAGDGFPFVLVHWRGSFLDWWVDG